MCERLKYEQTVYFEIENPIKQQPLHLINVCPDGWHVPTENDLDEMLAFYHKYGSNALFRNVFESDDDAHFYNLVEKKHESLDEKLIFWTATNAAYDDGKCVLLIQGNEIIKHFLPPQVALPVRCVKNK